MTSAENEPLAARHLRSVGDARVRTGPERGTVRQRSTSWRNCCRCVTNWHSCSGFANLRRLRPGHPDGEEHQTGVGLPGRPRPALHARQGRQEFSDLEEFAGRKLNAWDLAFYSERLQESRFKVSQEALRPYFPLPKVLSGLFALTQRLYGIKVR